MQRRLKRVTVSPLVLIHAAPGTVTVISNPIPPDARIVNSGYDPSRDEFYCILEHPSFAEVPPGEVIPVAPPSQWTRQLPATPLVPAGIEFK